MLTDPVIIYMYKLWNIAISGMKFGGMHPEEQSRLIVLEDAEAISDPMKY